MCKKYIHYGSEHFDLKAFEPIKNCFRFNKPKGGLWASPIDAEDSWYNFCKCNRYKTDELERSFEFKLANNTNVLYLNDVITVIDRRNREYYLNDHSLHNCIRINEPLPSDPFMPAIFAHGINIDFQWLMMSRYDAIEVRMDDIFYWDLYGWDVDSLLVMNPDCVVEL